MTNTESRLYVWPRLMWMQSRQRCLMDLSNLLKVLGTDKHYLDLQLRASRAVVRLQHIGQRSLYKNWSKNSEKSVGCIWIFWAVRKSTFFARFSLSDSRCMSDAITSTKLEQTGERFWDSRGCLNAWVSAFWDRRMKVKWGVTLFMCWL